MLMDLQAGLEKSSGVRKIVTLGLKSCGAEEVGGLWSRDGRKFAFRGAGGIGKAIDED
jgi:hypothetical protein